MDYIVAREFSAFYIIIDIVCLFIFAGFLVFFKKYKALITGILAGGLYFIVDFGIFHLALSTRVVNGANTALFLFWLSMSYGFTNFSWIWLLLERGKHQLEWSLIPILGWITTGLMATNFGSGFPVISISRKVGSYHGVMAAILLAGYLILIFINLKEKDPSRRAPIGRLLLIGIGVQLAWETVLLLTGIRPFNFRPLIINSLIETNLGLPFIYLIYKAVNKSAKKKRPEEELA